MAPFQVTITKRGAWRGSQEQYSNVYHYDTAAAITTDAGWDALIDAIVAKEKEMHGASVTYVQGRVNGPTNAGEAANVMRRIKDLSGTGTMTGSGVAVPAELAICVQLFLGRSTRGYKRFLRKYYHTRKLPTSGTTTDGFGETALSSGDQAYFESRVNDLKTITIGANANDLCAPNGDHLPLGTNAECLDYARTRQFRQ